MSTTVTKIKRVFRYNGTDLPDPGVAISPQDVCGVFAASGYAELQSATANGPTYEDGKEVYVLKTHSETKG